MSVKIQTKLGLARRHVDTPRSILKSASRFFSGTFLSRLTGLFRDMAMAYAFGATAAVAALMVAFRLAHLLRRLLGEGAMQMAFTPHFEELRHESHPRALAFFRDLKGSVSVVLVGLIIVGILLSYGLLKSGLLGPDNEEVLQLFIILLPSLFFICLFGLNAGLMQCEGHYFASGFAPVAFNLVWGGCALALKNADGAMNWMAWGIVLACFAQWAFTFPAINKIVRHDLPSWRPKLFSSDVIAVITPFSLAVIGVGATQINTALDALFGRYASLEGPAYLWYAIRVEQAPLALFGLALSTALFPPLSRAIKQKDYTHAKSLFSFAMQSIIYLLVPITYALLALGPHVINLTFGMGDFSNEAILETTYCLWGYTVGLRASAAVILIASMFYALGNYRVPTFASVTAVVGNIILNALLVMGAGLGAMSIAIATSVSSFINLFILSYVLRDLFVTSITSPEQRKTGLVCTLASLCAGAAAWGVEYWMSGSIAAVDMVMGKEVEFAVNFFEKLWICGVPAVVFFGVYLVFYISTQRRAKKQRYKNKQESKEIKK